MTCSACGKNKISIELNKFDLDMHKCESCGLVFTYPIPPLDTVAARYSGDWFEKEYLPSYGIDPNSPNLDHLADRFNKELNPLEKYRKCNRILDVGAGAGLFLSQAKKLGWEVYGVELSDFGPAYAKKHLAIDIKTSTLEDAKFEDKFFDVVMLQDTIEHVPQPKKIIEECFRILRPGGALVLSTPNYNSLGRRILGREWALISPMEHLALFSKASLSNVLKMAGFKIDNLHVNESVSSALAHNAGADEVSKKIKKLEYLGKKIPKWLIKKAFLGDELFCRAVA